MNTSTDVNRLDSLDFDQDQVDQNNEPKELLILTLLTIWNMSHALTNAKYPSEECEVLVATGLLV